MASSLVTGGAGFIGSHLVEALLASGRNVVALDDLSTGDLGNLDGVKSHPHFRMVIGSVLSEAVLRPLIAEVDEVFHLAAVVGVKLVLDEPERTVTTNVGATSLLLQLLKEQPKRLFLASTSEVYGKNPGVPLSEADDLLLGPPTSRRWVYACTKAIDEYLALAAHEHHGLPVVIGRFFNVVGPRQVGHYGMVIPRFIDQALRGEPLTVYSDGKQVRCFASVLDIVQAILLLMEQPGAHGQAFNLGSDQPVSIQELAERVVALIPPGVPIHHQPYEQVYGAGFEDIRCRIPDLTRTQSLIGNPCKQSLNDILLSVIDWKLRR